MRILSTTDLHGYIDVKDTPGGLSRMASVLHELRGRHENCLIFDNGDFLQGAPICDLAAMGAFGTSENPVLQTMNAIGYDAVGLGNHEFDYGLDYLRAALPQADFPVLCSNVEINESPWQRDLFLRKQMIDDDGQPHELKIGVFSVVPPHIQDWCRVHLEGKAKVQGFHSAASARIQALKNQGADLVIALCHAGDKPYGIGGNGEALASEIASIEGLDAIICGHTHMVSPPVGHTAHLHRTLRHTGVSTVPRILPGHCGRFVGCLELTLAKGDNGWAWVRSRIRNHAVTEQTPKKRAVEQVARPWINRCNVALRMPVGHAETVLSSHFATITCDAPTRLAAMAKLQAGKRLVANTAFADLPMVAAANPFLIGQDGPGGYVSVPAGEITLAHLFEIYPYLNGIDAFQMTGGQIYDWLEASASAFHQITPGEADQLLWNPKFAPYELDSILGLTYEIDLTRPALFQPNRQLVETGGHGRIRNLRLDGKPLHESQPLVLITNSYRGGGGGAYPHATKDNRIPVPFVDVRLELQDLLSQGVTSASLPDSPWRFSAVAGTSVQFETGPKAKNHLPNTLHKQLKRLEINEKGFATYRLSLETP